MATLRTKTVVQFAAMGLLLCSGGVLLWTFTATVSVPTPAPDVDKMAVEQPKGDDRQDDQDAPNRWDRLFARRLQRPLYDPVVEAPAVVVKKVAPPPPIQIIATMPEPDGGSAMIQDDRSRISVVPVGGDISAGGTKATLLKVYDDRVELQHDGKTVTMKLNVD